MRRLAATAALAALLAFPFVIAAGADEAASPAAPPAPAADTPADCDGALGRRVFAQCAICHSLEKDAAPVAGPNLYGVLGRPAASAPGFSYSRAMRESGKRWTREELDRFLAQPLGVVPGTSMAFGGLKKPEERAAVICHLTAAGRG